MSENFYEKLASEVRQHHEPRLAEDREEDPEFYSPEFQAQLAADIANKWQDGPDFVDRLRRLTEQDRPVIDRLRRSEEEDGLALP